MIAIIAKLAIVAAKTTGVGAASASTPVVFCLSANYSSAASRAASSASVEALMLGASRP